MTAKDAIEAHVGLLLDLDDKLSKCDRVAGARLAAVGERLFTILAEATDGIECTAANRAAWIATLRVVVYGCQQTIEDEERDELKRTPEER